MLPLLLESRPRHALAGDVAAQALVPQAVPVGHIHQIGDGQLRKSVRQGGRSPVAWSEPWAEPCAALGNAARCRYGLA